MPSPAPSRFTLRTALRRFRGNRCGSAAVEFALVAPMFFALLFAIIETALMFFASQVLETITQDSARVVLTGQAQSGSVASCAVNSVSTPCTQATFKSYVCKQIPALFDCNSLRVDVQSYSDFSSVTLGNYTACNFDPTTTGYNPISRTRSRRACRSSRRTTTRS
ncbi:TadE/TadG family type IV pilus assembly protein [Bradyrhizobium cytisi]|uniref:Pilus assembly protein n=1 Tax=Bradyrhizobium cytisi TaxID=515489 RepID=A0A5S4WH56_9BRAD|nr:TadE family protein [Bradyrhizobium cytisi]TYL74845.1 pilus assembly protein [Bradyrhizobium cytisi]